MTVEELVKMVVPAPFVKGQEKCLGDCSIKEIKEAAAVLTATDGSEKDIDFLNHLAHTLRRMDVGNLTVEEASYAELKHLAKFRVNQNAPRPKKAKAKK